MKATTTQRPTFAGGGNIRRRLLPLLAVAVTAIVIPAPAQALVINPIFETGLSAAAIAVINTAIGFYESTFSDTITVNIDFHNMTSGLGASESVIYDVTYADYRSLLTVDASSANDFTALAHLPASVPGGNIIIKSADARAVGFNAPGMTFTLANSGGFCIGSNLDGCVGLNVGLTTTGGGAYSLLDTVEHEIDEVLGLGSSLLAGNQTQAYKSAEDLFRYSSAGVLSYDLACNVAAYFSIDGGVTHLNAFNNCNNGGDYGDWVTHTPSQVQDAFTNGSDSSGLTVNSSEVTALDVIGYTLAPEPAVAMLLGVGFAGLFMARRRAQIKQAPRLDDRAAIRI